jgi:photosystem II stability/assembly factor-like uncharacterized protein
VSLLGKADFHVLRAMGSRVYGVDAASGALHVSDDGGQQWHDRPPPSILVDLVAAPGDRDRLVAAGERGLFMSRDAGTTWRPLARAPVGLLAWADAGSLHLVDGRGTVYRSADGGRRWHQVGRAGGAPAALLAHGSDLYVALHDNRVKVSRDGGSTWQIRVVP